MPQPATYQIGERVIVRIPDEREPEIGRVTQIEDDLYAVKLESGPLVWVNPGTLRRLPQTQRWRGGR